MSKINNALKKYTPNEYYMAILIISSFMSVYLCTFFLLILPFYALITKQKDKFIPKNRYMYLLPLFIFIGILSTFLFARDSDIFGIHLYAWYWKALSVVMIVAVFDIFFISNTFTSKGFDLVLRLSMIMSIFAFIISLIQAIFKMYASPDRPGRYASTFINENYFGMIIGLVIIVTVYYIFKENKRPDKLREYIFLFAVLIMNVSALWLCKSRTPFIALTVAILVFLSIKDKKLFLLFSLIFVILIVIVIKNPNILPRFDTILEYLSYRIGIWKAALKCFADNFIIGRGYFSYSGVCIPYFDEKPYMALHAHNMFIELFLDFGIIGAFSLFAFFLSSVKESIKTANKSGNKIDIAFIAAAFSYTLIQGASDITLFWPQTAILTLCILIFPSVYKKEG